MARWIHAGLKPLRIAVNVSARQLRRRDFCETVANALTTSGLPPELLELEITESSVMENPRKPSIILERLGRMGVTLAIDDFGTGYSSLAYSLSHRSPEDRPLLRCRHRADLNDRAIAFGTIALAHSLGLRSSPRGRNRGPARIAARNGCDESRATCSASRSTAPPPSPSCTPATPQSKIAPLSSTQEFPWHSSARWLATSPKSNAPRAPSPAT
jgi:hypothetical protein